MKTIECNPSGFSFSSDIVRKNNGLVLEICFSDNPYIMVKKSNDITELQKIQSIIDNRLNDYVSRKKNMLKTSDLGLTYIRN